MEKHTVTISKNKNIEFELVRKKVKNINLTIRPDLSITISANPDVPMEVIHDYVSKKSLWLMNRIGKYQQTKTENTIKHEYLSGESYKFLGKQYRLLVEFTTSTERVIQNDGFIVLYVREKRKSATKARLIDEWYRKNAAEEFKQSLNRIYPLVTDVVGFEPKIDFKLMKKRWGSCLRSKKAVLLNLELIKAPKYCIDYVMLHELVHFIHKDHDSKFYETLSVLMPDWKDRKSILDEEIVLFV
ncbi:MAG: hypothetical protein CVV57_10420 [Tenericutes bacterium HGW-Tenericutes-2]|jgi:hypothetical protein|nr:MAG: hypothetical protein CVV57_10420 [Tenericutes bacterium HGW-Tenericutes-2]